MRWITENSRCGQPRVRQTCFVQFVNQRNARYPVLCLPHQPARSRKWKTCLRKAFFIQSKIDAATKVNIEKILQGKVHVTACFVYIGQNRYILYTCWLRLNVWLNFFENTVFGPVPIDAFRFMFLFL